MEHITTLLSQKEDMESTDFGTSNGGNIENEANLDPQPKPTKPNQPQWCICSNCVEMPREIENKCCRRRTCIISRRRFYKFFIDPENLELCLKNTADVRNDPRDSSTRAFRKAASRQYVLWQHGYLGKGNRRVVPSCSVLKIRSHYPSPTGVYMGFRER